MIDPNNIVRSDYTDEQLQELLIFTICAAGKRAESIAPRVDSLFKFLQVYTGSKLPLNYAYAFPLSLWADLQTCGIGNYHMKARAIREVADKIGYDELNLRHCTPEQLEEIYGIGPKSARAFVMWSRPNESYAILDIHILKWLKDQGVKKVPKSTPPNRGRYSRLEHEFLKRVPKGMTPAKFDLMIWKEYARKNKAKKANANTGVTTVF